MDHEVKSANRRYVLLLSLIPAKLSRDTYETLSLWARDINTQVESQAVTLVCPVSDASIADAAPLSSKIRVVDLGSLNRSAAEALVAASDIVQVPGNFGWRQSAWSRKLLRLARKHGKLSIVGISSDRARTSWLNRGKGVVGFAKGISRYLDIRTAQASLARHVDGVFVVGEGVAKLARKWNSNVHVSTASWVTASDNYNRPPATEARPFRVCMASRLEAMKGVEHGANAVREAIENHLPVILDIVGVGPERKNLETQVERLGLTPVTRFLGQLAYPDEFHSYLRTVDFVLLTNLNVEQPRLIFDAISQGAIPLCPRSPEYQTLGLDDRLLYERGNPEELAMRMSDIILHNEFAEHRAMLRKLAARYTIEAMHENRRVWIEKLIVKDGVSSG